MMIKNLVLNLNIFNKILLMVLMFSGILVCFCFCFLICDETNCFFFFINRGNKNQRYIPSHGYSIKNIFGLILFWFYIGLFDFLFICICKRRKHLMCGEEIVSLKEWLHWKTLWMQRYLNQRFITFIAIAVNQKNKQHKQPKTND